jgi:DNA modification methylase
METNKIFNEPCLETLKRMPNDFIDCVITSPPYWRLRDYGHNEQWGLEPTFQHYLENLWKMMNEIYRVLKPSGSVWINLGDSYGKHNDKKNDSFTTSNCNGYNKCLLLLPHRFAIGCIERGWIVRNDIIWAKRNGMPESVTDRFSKKHEYVFFMVKSEDYFFDLDIIRDNVKDESLERYKYDFTGNKGGIGRDKIGYREGNKSHLLNNGKYKTLEIESLNRQGMNKDRGNNIVEKRPLLPKKENFVDFLKSQIKIKFLCENTDISKQTIDHWFRKDNGFSYPSLEHWNQIKKFLKDGDGFAEIDEKMTYVEYETDEINKNIFKGKNPSSVSDFWDVTTKGSKAEHYATFNDKLLVKPILCGCPEGGIIYDPFMGTGTTAEGCIRSNRKFIGSEISRTYFEIAEKRIKPFLDAPLLF